MNKEKGFTLLEVVIALGVLVILVSVATFGYSYVIDSARRKVCEGNLKVLKSAIEYYGMERDALPATLGQIERGHFDRAYAAVIGKDQWRNNIYSTIAKLEVSGESHAAFLTYDNLRGMTTEDHFKDPDVPDGGISYGINSSLAGKKWSEIGRDVIIVADSDVDTFNSLNNIAKRHRRGIVSEHLGMAITKGESILVFSEEMSRSTDTTSSGDIYTITAVFEDLVNSSAGTTTADKAEDVRDQLWTAISELSKSTPDTAAARGNLNGAMADLQAMIDTGLIDSTDGTNLMNQLQSLSAQL